MEHHNTASFSPLEHKSTTNSRISPPPPPPTRHLKRPQSSLLEIPSCCRLIWALHAATLGWEALARPQSQALGRGDTRPWPRQGSELPSPAYPQVAQGRAGHDCPGREANAAAGTECLPASMDSFWPRPSKEKKALVRIQLPRERQLRQ